MGNVSTYALLTALKTTLEALEWTDGSKVFDQVAQFSEPDLLAAYEQLYIFKKRVCLILPGSDDFQSTMSGRVLHFEVQRDFTLLIADREPLKPQTAHLGDSATSGVCAIKDHLVESLLGVHLGLWPDLLRIIPARSHPFTINEGEAAAAGRRCWQLDWQAVMGARHIKYDRLMSTTE